MFDDQTDPLENNVEAISPLIIIKHMKDTNVFSEGDYLCTLF